MSTRLRAALSLLLVSFPLLAQETIKDTAHIVPVVVTATRSPLSLAKQSASVSVVSGVELRRQGIVTVSDALRRIPGIAVAQVGSYGGASSLFIRGGESKFTKVLIDGVPVNEAGGAFDFSSLSTDNLDRIEVVRGPASVLYGSDAVAGVVQLFTRDGGGPPHGDLMVRGGGRSSYDAEGDVRGEMAGASYSLGAAMHGTKGFQEFNSEYDHSSISGAIRRVAGPASGRLLLRYAHSGFHFPTNGSGEVVDSNAMHRDDRLVLGAEAALELTRSATVRLALASNDVHGITDDQPDSPGDDQGYYYTTSDRTRRRSGDLRAEFDLPRATTFTVGATIERQWQASETQSNFGDNGFAAARRTSGAYAQLLLAPGPLSAALGARLEHNERFGDFATWRVGSAVSVTPSTRIRASAGTAFREPTFLENFGGAFVIGNPGLAPEHSLSFDAGIEQDIGGIASVSATWFRNSFRDLIDYRYSATEPNYFNLARTETGGAELEGRIFLSSGMHADASVTYLQTRVAAPGFNQTTGGLFAEGSHLLRRPMHTVDIGVGYAGMPVTLDLRAHRVGVREDVFYAPDFSVSRVTLPAYVRVDMSGEVPIMPTARRTAAALTLRIENLFDAHFTEAAGVNYDFARRDEQSLRETGYRGAGRRVLLGARMSY